VEKRYKIEASTTIEDIVKDYPELIRPLREFGIKCVACGEPLWGTLQENANDKGIENLETILDQLNKMIQNN
jgi:methionine synthase II (cobalamin-independent)